MEISLFMRPVRGVLDEKRNNDQSCNRGTELGAKGQ